MEKNSFSQRILHVIQREDKVIVLLRGADFAESDPFVGRNILAVNRIGEEVWRIAPTGWTRPAGDGRKLPKSWVEIYVDRDGKTIRAADSKGFHWKLDPRTGALSDDIFLK